VFHRVLIANRGEIAVRIIRACREMDVATVAVYSAADATAPHVSAADAAEPLGAEGPGGYLDVAAIVDAARRSGAEAVHPGYGFLAENAALAGACADAGLTFVGPTAEAIERMGSKVEARRHAVAAGLPVVPGEAPDQDPVSIKGAAARLGYPLLVKATAGGGGKGMRVVRKPGALAEAVTAARHEAEAAFGDGTLYLEHLLDRPRHVEVQVLGDAHGGAIHLFERDCSVQRRHQKVVEESPSPALSPALRDRMGSAAAALARHIGYRNAGTVEFLLEGRGENARFYFLEMNTRLQVEHPVTEAVLGIDLVQAQLRIAAGEPLPWRQADLHQRGHAIECRIYAEDPGSSFLPQAGTLEVYREPRMPGIRVDSGVVEGGEVSVHYDPLLAKLIALAETREAARLRTLSALRRYAVLGIRTNIPFLVRVLEHEAFRDGTIDTGFLDGPGAALAAGMAPDPARLRAAAAAVAAHEPRRTRAVEATGTAYDPWASLGDWGRR
jgi:acetyl-CoA carboxylase biotin carboxylase subunit